MATMTQYPPGTFCWTQLGTTDEEAAKKFYSGLFGWMGEKTSVNGHPFTLLTKNQKVIGALMAQGADQGPPLRGLCPEAPQSPCDHRCERPR